jgi:hypothetical protein
MAERKNTKNKPNKAKKGLDTFSQKRPVGRPGRVRASEVGGRSYNLRLQFGQIWDTVGEDLIRAQTQEDVLKTLDLAGQYWRNELGSSPGILSLIVGVVRDPKFPKKMRQRQINFLADSLAAWGSVSPRRSRDICEQERAKERAKSPHKIIRKEFYIECECSYKGPARDNACPKCGAEIPPSLEGFGIYH